MELATSFWSEIAPLELALAVRSGSVGAHSDDGLAEEGRGRVAEEETVEEAEELHLCSNLETLTWQVGKNVNSMVKRCQQLTTWENCRTSM